MARKSFKEEVARKSPWLNSKKKPEKVIKPIYPQVTFQVECKTTHGEEGHYTFEVTKNVEVVTDWNGDEKVWNTSECPKCGKSISGFFTVS